MKAAAMATRLTLNSSQQLTVLMALIHEVDRREEAMATSFSVVAQASSHENLGLWREMLEDNTNRMRECHELRRRLTVPRANKRVQS